MAKFFRWYGEKLHRGDFWILYTIFMVVCVFGLAFTYVSLAALTGGISVLVSILIGGYIVFKEFLEETKDV